MADSWTNTDPNSTIITSGPAADWVTENVEFAHLIGGVSWDSKSLTTADALLVAVYANGTRLQTIETGSPTDTQVLAQPTGGTLGRLRITFSTDLAPEAGDYYVVEYPKA